MIYCKKLKALPFLGTYALTETAWALHLVFTTTSATTTRPQKSAFSWNGKLQDSLQFQRH